MKQFLAVLFVPFLLHAQPKNEGVKFEHNVPNWNSIVVQATKENKHIFVDCYTTWCGPCKMMKNKIFPMKNVGDFYNANYISVALQIDETAKDDKHTIDSRPTAKQFEKDYNILAYPTFLVFNPQGKLVHKFVGGGDATDIIKKGKQALEPNYQYYTLLEKYKTNKTDAELVKQLCFAAGDAYESSEQYLGDFIKLQGDNIYTKDNAPILFANAENTNSIGFKHLYSNKSKWESVAGKATLNKTLRNAITQEAAETVDMKAKPIDWQPATILLEKKYPDFANSVMGELKLSTIHFEKNPKFYAAVAENYINSTPADELNPAMLNELAWSIFENTADKILLEKAANWSKKAIEKDELPAYLDTYANLLYKLGKTKDAIEQETKALKLVVASERKSFEATLNKMKKGEKTW